MFGPSARRSARVQSREAPHHRRRMAPHIALHPTLPRPSSAGIEPASNTYPKLHAPHLHEPCCLVCRMKRSTPSQNKPLPRVKGLMGCDELHWPRPAPRLVRGAHAQRPGARTARLVEVGPGGEPQHGRAADQHADQVARQHQRHCGARGVEFRVSSHCSTSATAARAGLGAGLGPLWHRRRRSACARMPCPRRSAGSAARAHGSGCRTSKPSRCWAAGARFARQGVGGASASPAPGSATTGCAPSGGQRAPQSSGTSGPAGGRGTSALAAFSCACMRPPSNPQPLLHVSPVLTDTLHDDEMQPAPTVSLHAETGAAAGEEGAMAPARARPSPLSQAGRRDTSQPAHAEKPSTPRSALRGALARCSPPGGTRGEQGVAPASAPARAPHRRRRRRRAAAPPRRPWPPSACPPLPAARTGWSPATRPRPPRARVRRPAAAARRAARSPPTLAPRSQSRRRRAHTPRSRARSAARSTPARPCAGGAAAACCAGPRGCLRTAGARGSRRARHLGGRRPPVPRSWAARLRSLPAHAPWRRYFFGRDA